MIIYMYHTPTHSGYWYYNTLCKNKENRALLISYLYSNKDADKSMENMIEYLQGYSNESTIYRRPAY